MMRLIRNLVPPLYVIPIVCVAIYLFSEFQKASKLVSQNIEVSERQIAKAKRTALTFEIPAFTLPERELIALSEKPIFAPDRKKYIPQVVKPIPKEKPAPKVVIPKELPIVEAPIVELLGVMGASNGRSALLRTQSEEKWYQTGDVISDWAIVSVNTSSITLAHENQEITVRLKR